jgi:hypothetical protein
MVDKLRKQGKFSSQPETSLILFFVIREALHKTDQSTIHPFKDIQIIFPVTFFHTHTSYAHTSSFLIKTSHKIRSSLIRKSFTYRRDSQSGLAIGMFVSSLELHVHRGGVFSREGLVIGDI